MNANDACGPNSAQAAWSCEKRRADGNVGDGQAAESTKACQDLHAMLSGSRRRAPHSVSMSMVQGGEGTAPEDCWEKDRERRRKAITGVGKWSEEGGGLIACRNG